MKDSDASGLSRKASVVGESSTTDLLKGISFAGGTKSLPSTWYEAVATAAARSEEQGGGDSGLGLTERSSDLCGGTRSSGGGGGGGEARMEIKRTVSRPTLLSGADEAMGRINEEEPDQLQA